MTATIRKPSTNKKVQKTPKASLSRKPAARKNASPPKKTKGHFSLNWIIVLAGISMILFSPLYYRYVLGGFDTAWHWINDIGENPNYRHYKSFNIHVSEKYTIHGIDVSYAQGKINWRKVKTMEENGLHISFTFIKATEGETFVDSYFQRNWREAAKAGLVCGAYHYFRPEKSGKKQAEFFIKTVKLEKGDLPLVVDVEKLDNVTPDKMREELSVFLSYIHHKTHIKPIIYSGLSFYQDNLKGYYDDYTLWIAHYNKPELQVNHAANWGFWQHSDKATIDGINHAVDFDTFKSDSVTFKNLLVQ